MKKILFLLLCTVSIYGQTYQNPTFGTITAKTSPLNATSEFITTTSSTGEQGKILGENITLSVIPPVTHFTPVTSNIKGYFQGVDQALGNIVATTAGITTRLWLTADQTTITAGTFYRTNFVNKGVIASAEQSVINDDNQKKYFTQDIIGDAYVTITTFPKGIYAGNLSVSASPNSAQQRFTVEVYKCNNAGTPIASGISGAVTGDLGVTVITILDSGLLTLADGSVTNVPVSNTVEFPFTVNVGERVRYHISAEKVGTAASNITEKLYLGTSYNSYIDVPVPLNTSSVQNLSNVDGATTTDALNNLNTAVLNKEDKTREKLIYSTNFISVADLSVSGAFTIVSTGLKSPASGTFGTTYAAYPKRTDLDSDVTRAIVTVNNASSVFGLIRKPFVSGIVGGTKASINGSTNTISIYKGWDGTNTNPGVSVSATIPFSLVVGKQYLLELKKVSGAVKTFSITDISSQQSISITANNEIDWAGSGWDYPAVSFESGDVTFNQLSFASELPANGLVMFSGDSYTEGSSVYNIGLGSYNKRWDKLAYDALQGNAIISGKGGDTALDLLNRNDIDFFKSRYHMFLIGANDSNYATWKTSYDAFIAKILANGQIPVLVTIAPRADRQAFINTANAYIKTLGYRVINFAKAISLNNDEVTLDPAFYLPDNVHPNLAGHAKLYNQLKIDFPLLFDKDSNLYNANNYGSFVTTSYNVEGAIIKDGINNQTGRMRMNNGNFNIFGFNDNTSTYLPIVLACNAANPAPPPIPTGKVLVGTIIDNGTDLLQVNGDINTKGFKFLSGTASTFNVSAQTDGSIFFSNGSGAFSNPIIGGKSSTATALVLSAANLDANTSPDMILDVRTITGTDFSDLTKVAYRFKRFNTNLIDILRNGKVTITDLAGTGTRQVVASSTGVLSAGAVQPLKYVALLTQTSTGAPTATVLENTLGATISYSYNSVGNYTGTLSSSILDVNKTAIILGINQITSGGCRFQTANTVTIVTTANGNLSNTTLEIRIYP